MGIGYLFSCLLLFDVAIAHGGLASLPPEDSGRSRRKTFTRRVRRAPSEHDPTERSKPFTSITDSIGLPIEGPSFVEERAVKLHGQVNGNAEEATMAWHRSDSTSKQLAQPTPTISNQLGQGCYCSEKPLKNPLQLNMYIDWRKWNAASEAGKMCRAGVIREVPEELKRPLGKSGKPSDLSKLTQVEQWRQVSSDNAYAVHISNCSSQNINFLPWFELFECCFPLFRKLSARLVS